MHIRIKIVVIIAGFIHTTISSNAQFTFNNNNAIDSTSLAENHILKRPKKPSVYILPNGTIIPENKVDSVAKSWGGLTMKRDLAKNPVEIELFPLTSKQATLIEIENSKKILDFIEDLTGKQAPDFLLNDINGKPIFFK